MVRLKVDGVEIYARRGETILRAARRANIHIPTLCHLSKLAPIASCRLCLVEVSGEKGLILSCQTPVREGMEVRTRSEALVNHRHAIMQLYAMNHPLECGVCDKSGECELQNRVHEVGMSEQGFSAREKPRARELWAENLRYDESLCITCERCVRVCNELVGASCLRVLPGGFSSRIGFVSGAHCRDCGECVAVCPVGALTSREFHYHTNAWELEKIVSSCPHCALACALEYEVKPQGMNGVPRIYRIGADREFGMLCERGRRTMIERAVGQKGNLNEALEAFKRADTIAFSSYITNEEALILQKLKESHGYKLYSPEARAFGGFADELASSAGVRREGSVQAVKGSDCIVALGGRFYDEVPLLQSAMSQAQKNRGAKLYLLHPLEESRFTPEESWRYEVGAEEGVVALLCAELLAGREIEPSERAFLEEVDWGYVSSESSLSEEEIAPLVEALKRASEPLLIIGADIYPHPRALNIARLLGMLQKYTEIKILLVPPTTNALGVALICDLDEEKGSYTIGYNTPGDYVLSSIESKANLLMPALNQQEGTFTNIDKRVIPIHPALPYEGYELNDIAKALGLEEEHTIDYTPKLPKEKGFLSVAFDSLPNHYDNDGREVRGYALGALEMPKGAGALEEIEEIGEYNGTVIYTPALSPEATTALEGKAGLLGSRQFAIAAKISAGDFVSVEGESLRWSGIFHEDSTMKGVVAILALTEAEAYELAYGYPFRRVRIQRLEGAGQ